MYSLEGLHMPTLLDQAGDSALLLGRKPSVFPRQNLSRVSYIARESFVIKEGKLVRVIFLLRFDVGICFTHMERESMPALL